MQLFFQDACFYYQSSQNGCMKDWFISCCYFLAKCLWGSLLEMITMLMKNACYLQDVNNPYWLTFPQNWWHWALSTSSRDQCSAYGFQPGWCTWWRRGDRSYKSKCQQIFKKNSAFWWRLFIISRDHCQCTGTLIIVFKCVHCSCQRKLVLKFSLNILLSCFLSSGK